MTVEQNEHRTNRTRTEPNRTITWVQNSNRNRTSCREVNVNAYMSDISSTIRSARIIINVNEPWKYSVYTC